MIAGLPRRSSSSVWDPAGFWWPATCRPLPASSGPSQGGPEPPRTGEDRTWGIGVLWQFFLPHSMQSQTFGVNGARINQEERLYSLRSFIQHLYLRHAEMYCALQIFWNESIWIKMLTGAENTHLGRNCTVKKAFHITVQLCSCAFTCATMYSLNLVVRKTW